MERQLDSTARLFGSSLSLKFKLTSSLLDALGEPNQRTNQSRALWAASMPIVSAQSHQPDWALRIQCKYKLTEVSDVTFNELQLWPTDASRQPDPLTLSAPARLAKTTDNEVAQTPNPARRFELERLVARISNQTSTDTCQLELQPDDPLIVVTSDNNDQPGGRTSAVEPDWLASGAERRRRHLDSGRALELDCLTLSSIRAAHETLTCDQPAVRKRALVSGLAEERNSAQHWPGHQRALVAYLSLGASGVQQPADRDALSAGQVSAGSKSARADSTPLDWLAPPLLEWFINNQEVSGDTSSGDQHRTHGR